LVVIKLRRGDSEVNQYAVYLINIPMAKLRLEFTEWRMYDLKARIPSR
jgi:hypothetical protein